MKVLQFTIPVGHDKSIISEQFDLPFFYPYLHRHQEAQLTWIQQGEGTLIAGNSMHNFKAGEIYLLGANLPHLFKSGPEYFIAGNNKSIKATTIFFNPNGKLSSLFELEEMNALKSFIQQTQMGFKLADEHVKLISRMMLKVENSTGSEKLLVFFQMLNYLNNVKDHKKLLSSAKELNTVKESESVRIGNIYNYIAQHYSEAITLDDVAEAACMTPQAFCRYFKKHTGHTYISFLNEIRINEACKRLVSNKFESVSTIAHNCGFNTITNFNRVFKCITGTSPKGYLESYLKNTKVVL